MRGAGIFPVGGLDSIAEPGSWFKALPVKIKSDQKQPSIKNTKPRLPRCPKPS